MTDRQAQSEPQPSAEVNSHSRRAFVAAAVLAGATASAVRAGTPANAKGAAAVKIERFELTQAGPSEGTQPGLIVPRISFAVAKGDVVYTSGVTAHIPGDGKSSLGDVKAQTLQILAKIDQLLAMAGTSKSNLISAQIWLTDMRHFSAHNEAWNEWVDHDNPPVRACLLSPELWTTGLLVEIMVTAAR